MEKEIVRPAPPEDKVNTKNDWELCYLRHQYFRRVKYNPTEEEMSPYMSVVEHLTKNTYFTYIDLFRSVGMNQEDVLNIGRVHLVSFLGLYHLDRLPEKKRDFVIKRLLDKNREPTEYEFLDKNKANLTCFFKQRMEDLVRVCTQKVRNVSGRPSQTYSVFYGESKPPKYTNKLLRDYEELGYKKIDLPTFKSIRKKANVSADATIFKLNNLWYVAIPLAQRKLEIEDLIGSDSNPYQNEHNMQPDEVYDEKESGKFLEIFNKKSNYRKKAALRNFIAKNRNKMQYIEEISAAKKILKSLGE